MSLATHLGGMHYTGFKVPTPAVSLISHWTLNTDGTDSLGVSNAIFTGTPETALSPLVNDGGHSIGFNSAIFASTAANTSAYSVGTFTIVLTVQPDTLPATNRVLLSKVPAIGHSGELSIEQVNSSGTSKMRAYLSLANGTATFIGSSSGVADLALNVATQIAIRYDGATAEILYRTGSGSFTQAATVSSADLSLTGNNGAIVFGGWSQAGSNGFDGVIDDVYFYSGAADNTTIAALPFPTTITHTSPIVIAYTLPVVPQAPSGTVVYVSSGVGTGAATAGNDTTGNGSLATPYKTLSKALSVVASGGLIVLRKGVYRESSLSVSVTNVKIRGYSADIDDDPLQTNNWPVLDGGIDMSAVSWELVDSGRQEYRTTATNLLGGSGAGDPTFPQGAIYAGSTAAIEVPRYEPQNGMINNRRMHRLLTYSSEGTTGPVSFADSFRQSGTVPFIGDTTTGHVNYYLGPGISRGSTGKIHIRLQPVDSSAVGTVFWTDPFSTSYSPANHQVFLWARNTALFTTLSNGTTLDGLYIRNYDYIYHSSARDSITIKNCVWRGWHYVSGGYSLTGGNSANFLFDHCIAEGGIPDWFCFGQAKNSAYATNVGANYGRTTPFVLANGTTHTGWKLTDSAILQVFDVVFGAATEGSDIEIAYSFIIAHDDMSQMNKTIHQEHIHHCYSIGSLYGQESGTTPATCNKNIHHNLSVTIMPWHFDDKNYVVTWTPYTPHSPGSSNRMNWYHNTWVSGNPAIRDIIASGSTQLGMPTWGYSSSDTFGPYYTMNCICVVVNRVSPSGRTPSARGFWGGWNANDPTRKWVHDGNGFYKLDQNGLSGGALFANIGDTSGSQGGNNNYTSLATWLASALFTHSKNAWYTPGAENSSVEGNPSFSGGDVMLTADARFGVPAKNYRPTANNYKTGAINLTSSGLNVGWPSTTTYQAWRGALDPNGDGSEIGPR